jgi:hypothetical protein
MHGDIPAVYFQARRDGAADAACCATWRGDPRGVLCGGCSCWKVAIFIFYGCLAR